MLPCLRRAAAPSSRSRAQHSRIRGLPPHPPAQRPRSPPPDRRAAGSTGLAPPAASRPLWVGSVPVAAGSALSPTTGGHGHDVAGDLPPCISPLRRLSPFIPFQLICRLNNYLMIDVVLNHVYITYLLVLFLGL